MSDYKVALEISAAGNVEQFLSTIASRLLGIHAKAKEVEKSLGNWGKLIGGASLAAAGFETLKFVDHIAKAGGELQRQANIFRSAGNSLEDTAAAVKGAFQSIGRVPGIDAVDAMKRYRELAGATQDNAGSIKALPDFLRAQVVYGTVTGADAEEGMARIAKMIELRQGAINRETHKIEPERFVKELDVAVKALQVGQGLITSNDLQMLVKQAGPMAKGMDPLKFWSIYLASLEDMNGARTGTALTAAARQVLGGIMTPKVADEWERVGMLNPIGQGWNMKKGHVNIDDPKKAIRGYNTFRDEGFQKFIEDFVRPALNKAGFKSDNELNAELYKFGSTETARRLFSMYLTGDEQVNAEQTKIKKALGLDAFDSVFKGGDYQQGMDALTASIKSLEEALGGPAGRAVGEMASKLAEQINKLAQVAHDNPQLVEVGTYALTAAGGLAILAGSILSITAALRIGGWITGAGAAAEGAAAGAAASAAGGGLVKKLGLFGAVVGLTEALDPKGNFGGLTDGIDNWVQKRFGFNPSNVQLPSFGGGAPAPAANSPAAPVTRQDLSYMLNQAYARQADMHPVIRGERDMEGARAAALSKLPPPVINVAPPKVSITDDIKLDSHVTVMVDGKAIAGQVVAQVLKRTNHPRQSPNFDSGASFATPDYQYAT